MKSKFLFLLLSLFIFKSSISQTVTLDWVQHLGGTDFEKSKGIAIDNDGNVYTTGYFQGTADFDSGLGSSNLTSLGSKDVFIQKSDANGNLLWVKQIGGIEQVESTDIQVDAQGNIYTVGVFFETVDFDPGTGVYNLTQNGNQSSAFLQKLDTDGNFVWAINIQYSYGHALTLDNSGHVLISGTFGNYGSTVDFDPGVGVHNLSASTVSDGFILQLDTSGNFVWVKQFTGGGVNLHSLDVDQSGDIYSSGRFGGTIDFDPGIGTFNLTANIVSIGIVKLDNNGNFIWAKQIQDGTNSVTEPTDITFDDSNNVFITSSFHGSSDFDPGVGITNLTSNGFRDVFILKLDSNGEFIWVKQIGGAYRDISYAITSDNAGNIFTIGSFMSNVDFDPGIGVHYLNGLGADIFILKLDNSGEFLWAKNFGGAHYDEPADIQTNGTGNIYSTGMFTSTADFDPESGTTNTQYLGFHDVYIQKLQECNTLLTPDTATLPTLTDVCSISQPNIPTASNDCGDTFHATTSTTFPLTNQSISEIIWTFNDGNGNITTQNQPITWLSIDATTTLNGFSIFANNSNATYQWLDCRNYSPINGETNQTYTPLTTGSYSVQVTENGCVDTSDCVTITTVNINEFTQNIQLNIYPNPSSDVFNVDFNNTLEHVEITVTDVLGKIILASVLEHTSQANINLKGKAVGMYWLTVTTYEGQKTVKLIKE